MSFYYSNYLIPYSVLRYGGSSVFDFRTVSYDMKIISNDEMSMNIFVIYLEYVVIINMLLLLFLACVVWKIFEE